MIKDLIFATRLGGCVTAAGLIAIGVLVLCLTACEPTPQEARNRVDQANVASQAALENPDLVGHLPNGQAVYRSTVTVWTCLQCTGPSQHYVYFTGNDVTTNWDERHGKTTVQETAAMLNIRPNMTVDEVIEVANKAKSQREAAERAQWEQLNKKYGKQ